MNLGSLFVTLGAKGAGPAKSEVSGLQQSLQGAAKSASSTVEALTTLSSALGISVKSLQLYQTAARQVGVSNQEMQRSFQGLQASATKAMGAAKPSANVSRVATVTGGGMGKDDLAKYAAQPDLFLEKLQEYARLESNAGLRAQTLKSFGVTSGVAGALSRGAFHPAALMRASSAAQAEEALAVSGKKTEGFKQGFDGERSSEDKKRPIGPPSSEIAKETQLWSGLGKEAGGALKTVNEGIKGTASQAFIAKAAVVGYFYALQALFRASGKTGTNLTNFSALTGMSSQDLERHQYAGRQAGVEKEDVASGLAALQKTAFNVVIGEGVPKLADFVNQKVGGMTENDMKRYSERPEELLQKLQLFAQREKNIPLRNEALAAWGLSPAMIAALVKNAFTPETMAKAPTYSDSQVKGLDQSRAAWANLGDKFERAVGSFNSAHGAEIVGKIGPIVDSLTKLADALLKFAERAKIFELIGLAIKGWTAIFSSAAEAATTVSDVIGKDPKKAEAAKKKSGGFSFTDSLLELMLGKEGKEKIEAEWADKKAGKPAVPPNGQRPASPPANLEGGGGSGGGGDEIYGGGGGDVIPLRRGPTAAEVAAPPMAASIGSNSTQNVEVTQTLNFAHEGKNAKETGTSVQKAIRDAYRQFPALSQGS